MRTIAFWLSLLLISSVPTEGIVNLSGFGTISRLIGFVTLAVWIMSVVVKGELRKPHPFHLAVYYFVFWNLISYFWSADVDLTMVRLNTLFQLLAFTLILWDLYTTPAALRTGLQAYVLGAYVAIGSALANYLSGQITRAAYVYAQRFSGADFDVNEFALVLALGLPVAWHLAVSVVENSKMSYVLRIVNYAYIPAALFAILLTASRTALFSTLPAFLFILGRLARLKLSSRLLILMALTGSLFVLQPLVPQHSLDRLATTGTSISEGDLGGRVRIWRRGFDVFLEHLLLGIGSGASRVAAGRPLHNTFLSVLVDLGIIGFALFAIILAIVVRQAIHQPRWQSGLWLTILLIWAIGVSMLGWEHRKTTWLFLSLVVVSANASVRSAESRQLSGPSQASAGTIHPVSSLPAQASQTKANHNFTS